MAPVDLATIRARADAATPPPWKATYGMDARCSVLGPSDLHVRLSGHTDAAFIAASRSDIPALCDEVAHLRAAVERAVADLINPAVTEGWQLADAVQRVIGDLRQAMVG